MHTHSHTAGFNGLLTRTWQCSVHRETYWCLTTLYSFHIVTAFYTCVCLLLPPKQWVFFNTTLLPSFEWVLSDRFITVEVSSEQLQTGSLIFIWQAPQFMLLDMTRKEHGSTLVLDMDYCQWRCFSVTQHLHMPTHSWLSSLRLCASSALSSPVMVSQATVCLTA